jgi:pyrimidine operon attenuation protein/uracil phosphoribosyltransferase
MGRVLARMAFELVERTAGAGSLVLVGIQRRGVQLADRLAPLIESQLDAPLRRGTLDITLVIVDDVLFTGRTVRAALDEIADFGRARRILLAVLVDRGGRELPIAADVTGLLVTTTPGDHVAVHVRELDGHDSVDLVRGNS